jgi:hypothetical protein
MKVYILQYDSNDSDIDSVWLDKDKAEVTAEATGALLSEVEISETLRPEIDAGLSFWNVGMHSNGQLWGTPHKTEPTEFEAIHLSYGVLSLYCWAKDEADAIAKARAELERNNQ